MCVKGRAVGEAPLGAQAWQLYCSDSKKRLVRVGGEETIGAQGALAIWQKGKERATSLKKCAQYVVVEAICALNTFSQRWCCPPLCLVYCSLRLQCRLAGDGYVCNLT